MTHDGSVACKQLEEYLISKLGRDHAGVKYKVLRIIRFSCDNGCSTEFRRLVQRKSDVIRGAQSFRGSPDPLRGDAPNKAVRDEAAALLRSLFVVENGVKPPTTRDQRVQSHEYNSFREQCTSSSHTASGSRRMESMGNPYLAPIREGPHSAAVSLSELMRSENPTRDILSAVSSGVQSMVDAWSRKVPSQSASSNSGNYSSHVNEWIPPKLHVPAIQGETRREDLSVLDVKNVVIELCQSNPARVAPSAQSLELFVAKSSELNGVLLGQVMLEKLSDSSIQWVHKMKLLAGIEALHAAGIDVVIETIKQNQSVLTNLFSSSQCGAKAKQVASLLAMPSGEDPALIEMEEADLIGSDAGERLVLPSKTNAEANLIDFSESLI